MSTYYLHDGRNELGPFTLDILKQQKLTRSTPVRQKDTDKWTPAEGVDGLKEIVAPRKIKRPKDVLPVMMERASDFKRERPKTAYAVMLSLGLLGGFSLYSLGKNAGKAAPNTGVAAAPVVPSASTAIVIPVKTNSTTEAPKDDKEKTARQHWNRLFSVANSSYGIGFLGGIKDLKVVVTNRSDYPLDEAVAKVTYIKANGEVWKTKLITVNGVPAHDSKEQSVPDVGRSKKVAVSLQKLISKKLKFTYTAGKKVANLDDPYLMQ